MPINPADRSMSDEQIAQLLSQPSVMPERSAPAFMYDEGMEYQSISLVQDELPIYLTTVQEQGLAGEESDFVILARARAIGCTLVVHDKAFRLHHLRLQKLSLTHAGILYVPINRTVEDVANWIIAAYERSIELDAPALLHHLFWRV